MKAFLISSLLVSAAASQLANAAVQDPALHHKAPSKPALTIDMSQLKPANKSSVYQLQSNLLAVPEHLVAPDSSIAKVGQFAFVEKSDAMVIDDINRVYRNRLTGGFAVSTGNIVVTGDSQQINELTARFDLTVVKALTGTNIVLIKANGKPQDAFALAEQLTASGLVHAARPELIEARHQAF